MIDDDIEKLFLAAGLAEDQVDIVLDHFHGLQGAPAITSVAEYAMAKSTYAAMDAYVPSTDIHSAVARYVISLGARIVVWEEQLGTTNFFD